MAADWRDWRLIVVNGERYRWQVDYVYGEGFGRLRVRPEGRPSRLLFVIVDHYAGMPSVVRTWIETAIADGWPDEIVNLELFETAPNDPTSPSDT